MKSVLWVLGFIFICLNSKAQFNNLYSKQNILQALDTNNSRYILIIKNNRNCYSCFASLRPLLDTLKQGKLVDSIVAVILADSGLYNTAYEISSLKGRIDRTLYDYTIEKTTFISQKPKTTSLFKIFNIYATPAIVILNKGKFIYIPANELFLNNGLKPIILDRVIKFLKK